MSGGLSPGAVPGNGGGHHRFERQDGHQGVDCRGTARGDEVLPFAQELQFAAGRAAVGADDRGRRAAGADRGGDFETRGDGAAGAHHPSRRGGFHLDRRRAPGEFPQPGAEMRRKDGSGPPCRDHRLPQLLRAAGPHDRLALRGAEALRRGLMPRGPGDADRQRGVTPQRPDRRGVLRGDGLSRAVVYRSTRGRHASRSQGRHQRLGADQRRLQPRSQLAGPGARLPAQRGVVAPPDARAVGYRAERADRRRTLRPRGGNGRAGRRRYARRHRSQTEALRRAVRLRQGVLRLDRRVHLPHRPQGRGRACRLVERRAGVPFRETRACAGAQEPHDGSGGSISTP